MLTQNTISPSSRKYGEITMSEAIILYRGRGSAVDPESLKPQVITSNGEYVAPVTGTYWIGAVGGGGGGGGGCRNIWNSGQVYYGAGGTRGGLNSGNVNLNTGDRITVTLGSGGANGTNNTTVVSYNSRGTSGSAGSTTTFGSYKSAAGGAAGSYSWMWRSTTNTITGWNNVITGWNNVITGYTQGWMPGQSWEVLWGTIWVSCSRCGANVSIGGQVERCPNCRASSSYLSYTDTQHWGWVYTNVWTNIPQWSNTPIWNNKAIWRNTYTNQTTRCYTSIQQGTWWYQNASNNQVSTSGTRTYRGDGGASGRVGNAGFIVIIPPTI